LLFVELVLLEREAAKALSGYVARFGPWPDELWLAANNLSASKISRSVATRRYALPADIRDALAFRAILPLRLMAAVFTFKLFFSLSKFLAGR
jgi:hypothetical protein